MKNLQAKVRSYKLVCGGDIWRLFYILYSNIATVKLYVYVWKDPLVLWLISNQNIPFAPFNPSIQSTKILLVHTKYETIVVLLICFSFNIAIAIFDFSTLFLVKLLLFILLSISFLFLSLFLIAIVVALSRFLYFSLLSLRAKRVTTIAIAIVRWAITIWGAIEKRNYESFFKTEPWNEAKILRVTTFGIAKLGENCILIVK